MTQTLRRERKQKFLAILNELYPTSARTFNEIVAEKLADAAMSRSELSVEAEFDKPNIYKIYEANIGPLTPMIADELNDIEKTYPEGWFLDACKEAVKSKALNIRYILKVLSNRKAGKDLQDKPDIKEPTTIPEWKTGLQL